MQHQKPDNRLRAFLLPGLGDGFGGYTENLVRSPLARTSAGGQVTFDQYDASAPEAVIDNQRNVIALGEFADGKRLPQIVIRTDIFRRAACSWRQRLAHLFCDTHAGRVAL